MLFTISDFEEVQSADCCLAFVSSLSFFLFSPKGTVGQRLSVWAGMSDIQVRTYVSIIQFTSSYLI